MKGKDFIPIVFLLALTGCYSGIYLPGVEVHTNLPRGGSGVLVTNNIPESIMIVEKVGFRTIGVVGKIKAGESVFVRTDFVMDRHEMSVKVVGRVDSTYIGSYTKKYSFSSGQQKIYTWDVNSLRVGRY